MFKLNQKNFQKWCFIPTCSRSGVSLWCGDYLLLTVHQLALSVMYCIIYLLKVVSTLCWNSGSKASVHSQLSIYSDFVNATWKFKSLSHIRSCRLRQSWLGFCKIWLVLVKSGISCINTLFFIFHFFL